MGYMDLGNLMLDGKDTSLFRAAHLIFKKKINEHIYKNIIMSTYCYCYKMCNASSDVPSQCPLFFTFLFFCFSIHYSDSERKSPNFFCPLLSRHTLSSNG